VATLYAGEYTISPSAERNVSIKAVSVFGPGAPKTETANGMFRSAEGEKGLLERDRVPRIIYRSYGVVAKKAFSPSAERNSTIT
jgi:hypothetical protein